MSSQNISSVEKLENSSNGSDGNSNADLKGLEKEIAKLNENLEWFRENIPKFQASNKRAASDIAHTKAPAKKKTKVDDGFIRGREGYVKVWTDGSCDNNGYESNVPHVNAAT